MKNIFLYLFVFIINIGYLIADPIDTIVGKTIARNFYFQNNRAKSSDFENLDFKLALKKTVNATDIYYIYNISNNQGWIIVAADNSIEPILGYSFEGNFINTNQSPAFVAWMDSYTEEILYIKQNNIKTDNSLTKKWNKLISIKPDVNEPEILSDVVIPLLSTTWNQNCYYNTACPYDAKGPCNRVYAGCVATAMGQIMKYWEYPNIGSGSSSYNHKTYGTLSANYGETTYEWSSMPQKLYSNNDAVANLLYHCGVSVEMDYSPTGSGAYSEDVPFALKYYFQYSSAVKYVYSYTNSNWINLLKNELNNSRPIYYSGAGNSGGHAFVCDGYDSADKFHFNWGWGGSNDGYFTIGNLNPGSYTFNNYNMAVIYIMPSTYKECPNYDFILVPSFVWETLSSNIDANGYEIYKISVKSKDPYIFKTGCSDGATADFNTKLYLYDKDCNEITSDDNACENGRSKIEWTADYTGVVYLKVASADDSYGNYTLAYKNLSTTYYHYVSTSSNPSIGGKTTGGGSFLNGSSCTVNATANDGYYFLNWTEDNKVVSNNSTYNFTVINDRNLVANFISNNLSCDTISNTEGNAVNYHWTSQWGYVSGHSELNWTEFAEKFTNTSQQLINGLSVLPARAYDSGVESSVIFKVYDENNSLPGEVLTSKSVQIKDLSAGNWNYIDFDNPIVTSGNYFIGYEITYTSPHDADTFCVYMSPSEAATYNTAYARTSSGWNSYDKLISGSFQTHLWIASINCSPVTWEINVFVEPEIGGTVSGSGTYTDASPCTLEAIANNGYVFLNWTENGEIISTNSNLTFTVSNDRTLTANFRKKCLECPSYNDTLIADKNWQIVSASIEVEECNIYRLSVIDKYVYTFKTGCNDGAIANFDTKLYLYDNECKEIISDDNSCENNRSKIEWTANYTGDAYLAIAAADNSFGEYTLAYKHSKPIPYPAGTIEGDTNVCQGQEDIIYSIPLIEHASSYAWTLPQGAVGNSNSNVISVSFTNDAQSGEITVKGINEHGEGEASSILINVNETPELSVISTVCSTDLKTYEVEFTASIGNVSSSAGTIIGNTIINIPVGINITITVNNNFCISSIDVVAPDCSCPFIQAPINPNSPSICEGSPTPDLTVEVPSGYTVNWFTSSSGGSAITNGTSFTPTDVNPGVYTYYAETEEIVSNCKSLRLPVTLTIIATPQVDILTDVTECDAYVLPILTNGNYYQESGGIKPISAGTSITATQTIWVYAETGTTPNCTNESSFTVNIFESETNIIDISICEGEEIEFNGEKLTKTGQYPYIGQSEHACDSIVILNLTVNPTFNETIDATICQGEEYDYFGEKLTKTGQYTYFGQNEYGCDSVITLNLIVDICENISDSDNKEIIVYPNPTSNYFNISLDKTYSEIIVSINDISGKTVFSKRYTNVSMIENISINNPSGLYLMTIQSDDKTMHFKLLKK